MRYMDDAMLNRAALLVPALLVIQAVLTHWAATGERPPAPPEFARFPAALGDWQKAGDEPVTAAVLVQLGADATLSSIYSQPKGRWMGSLFVAWFRSQRGGASQPHSPQVCLPASGWVPAVADLVAMAAGAGSVSVNRYIASLGGQRVVVLYWYQTRGRVTASEWAAKFWVISDRLKERRTDTSLVRVVVWNMGRPDAETTSAALDLAERAYPVLSALFRGRSLALPAQSSQF